MRNGFIGDKGVCWIVVPPGLDGEGVSGDQYDGVRAAVGGGAEEEMVVVAVGSGKVERRGRGGGRG